MAYYALHLLGASDWIALLVATFAAGVRLVWVAVRSNNVTWFAAVMFAVFGLGLVLSFISDDPRFLLLKDSFGTGAAGLVHLISLATARPFALAAAQAWRPHQAELMAQQYRTDPRVRRVFRVSGLVWGVGLLAESVARIPLIYLLPISVSVGLSTLMMAVAGNLILVWNIFYISRARKHAPGLLAQDTPALAEPA